MEDNLLCRMICNPSKISRKTLKNNNYDEELLNMFKRKFPEHIINLNDLNHIYQKIEEIHKINLINELIEESINGAIIRCVRSNNKSAEIRNINGSKKKI